MYLKPELRETFYVRDEANKCVSLLAGWHVEKLLGLERERERTIVVFFYLGLPGLKLN